MYVSMNPIDMGIGLYYLSTALEAQGKTAKYVKSEPKSSSAPSNYFYFGSLKVSE